MTTIWNQHVLTALGNGTLNLANQNIGLMLLYSYAVPSASSPDDATVLVTQLGFQELDASTGYNRAGQVVLCNTNVSGNVTAVVIGANFALTLTKQAYVAAGLYYVSGAGGAPITIAGMNNPWLFLSDDMFGNVVTPGAVVGTSATPKTLFSYSPIVGPPATATVSLGTIVQSPGPTAWESARIQHVYLYPMRVNFLPNPSGEDVGLFGWRSDGTLTRVTPGIDAPGNHYLHTTGKVLESVSITSRGPMRFSAYVKSPTAGASVTLKLMCLDESYAPLFTVAGKTRPLSTDWTRVDDVLVPSDDSVAVIPRIEASTSPMDVDLCLLSAGEALHDYFDGDSDTGLPGDFTWQGNVAQTYSCYYANRYNTAARLFGEYKDGQVTKPALVQSWVPTGTSIATHWDCLDVNDTKHPLRDWSSRVFTP